MRSGHDGGGLDGPKQGTAVTVIDGPNGQEITCRFGLADPQPGQGWIMPAPLQSNRLGQVGFRCPMPK